MQSLMFFRLPPFWTVSWEWRISFRRAFARLNLSNRGKGSRGSDGSEDPDSDNPPIELRDRDKKKKDDESKDENKDKKDGVDPTEEW